MGVGRMAGGYQDSGQDFFSIICQDADSSCSNTRHPGALTSPPGGQGVQPPKAVQGGQEKTEESQLQVQDGSCYQGEAQGGGLQLCLLPPEGAAAHPASRQEALQDRNPQALNLLHILLGQCAAQ